MIMDLWEIQAHVDLQVEATEYILEHFKRTVKAIYVLATVQSS